MKGKFAEIKVMSKTFIGYIDNIYITVISVSNVVLSVICNIIKFTKNCLFYFYGAVFLFKKERRKCYS